MNTNPKIKLDARPDRIDLRDRLYQPPLRNLEPVFPTEEAATKLLPLYAEHQMVLDQGKEGACTGFGLAAMINYLYWRRGLERWDGAIGGYVPPPKVSARMLYHLARFYDEWPGEDYEGSSCRGAIKAWHRHGVCTESLWPYRNTRGKAEFVSPTDGWERDAASRSLGVYYRIEKDSVTNMQAAIQEVGAIYVSADVHSGWMSDLNYGEATHDGLPAIPWTADDPPSVVGGHAFALVGYNTRGFIVQNSWADRWGLRGFAVLTYGDWLANGTDAWACVLGVPRPAPVPRHYTSSTLRNARKQSGPARLFGVSSKTDSSSRVVGYWEDGVSFRHTLVLGNEGKVINRLVAHSTPADAALALVYQGPKDFFDRLSGNSQRRLAIYAHGGLNSEEDSLARIRSLGPYFEANGIYPLFLTWRTGLKESLVHIMEDAAGRWFPRREGISDWIDAAKGAAEDALDRTLEVASANLGVKAIWSQMKQNAAAGALRGAKDRGGFLTSECLMHLAQDIPKLEIHLIGHSAGSILLGHMLDDFRRLGLKVETFTLYAPACTLDFANRYLAKAAGSVFDKENLHVHYLSDARERDDTVGPYRKSLLYLVSRALEDWHKTPILGLENALIKTEKDNDIWSPNTRSARSAWRNFMPGVHLHRLDSKQVPTALDANGEVVTIDSAHGSFDNDLNTITETLLRILGSEELGQPIRDLRY